VSTINCIFIFVSDIGADAMVRLMLGYGERGKVPLARYRKEVKSALAAHASTTAVATSVREVVPFMPMTRTDVELVLRAKLQHISSDHRGVFWQDLSVDAAVLSMMSGGEHIKYKTHSTKIATKTTATPSGGAPAPAPAVSEEPELNQRQQQETPGAMTRSQSFAVYGARALGVLTPLPLFPCSILHSLTHSLTHSLLAENAGPLQDLRSLLFRHMRPWRPGRVLHVGLVGSDDGRRWLGVEEGSGDGAGDGAGAGAGVGVGAGQAVLELRWCKVSEAEADSPAATAAAQCGASLDGGSCTGGAATDDVGVGVGKYADRVPDTTGIEASRASRDVQVTMSRARASSHYGQRQEDGDDPVPPVPFDCELVWRGPLSGH
jgi:hypothetical protein